MPQQTIDQSRLLANRAAHTLFEMDCSPAVHMRPAARLPVDGDFLRRERLLLTQSGREGLRIPFVPCRHLLIF
jgi:hypothetical protein